METCHMFLPYVHSQTVGTLEMKYVLAALSAVFRYMATLLKPLEAKDVLVQLEVCLKRASKSFVGGEVKIILHHFWSE